MDVELGVHGVDFSTIGVELVGAFSVPEQRREMRQISSMKPKEIFRE